MRSVFVTAMEKVVKFRYVPNKRCIIEFQAFIDNSNEFIVKDLVILDLETNAVNYFLFKPPHSYKKLSAKAKRTNNWLTKHFHSITWNEGFVEYKELDNITYHYCQQFGTIYTTGLKKVKFISQYTSDTVVNYLISKNLYFNTGDGFCNSVQQETHKLKNCSLVKTYCILAAMGQIPNNHTVQPVVVGRGRSLYKLIAHNCMPLVV